MTDQSQQNNIPLLELMVSIIGFIIVFGVVGYLLYQAVLGEVTPPDIQVEQTAVLPLENGYLVKVNVTNLGSESAAGVTIEGTLTEGSEEIETGEATIDYIAGESHNIIGLFFIEDPAQYTLELRALGYQDP